MTYIIKCIAGIHSKGDFMIKGGQELEVSKEIYDYFNNNYGPSGNFNFKTTGTIKKVSRVTKIEKEDETKETVTKTKVSKD